VNKNLLLINYYWPPSGGPAVQRWLSLTAELAKLGWNIWVLTVDEKYATYQLYDNSLEAQIHPSVKVVKTRTIEPFGIFRLLFGKKSIPAPGFSNEANPSFTKRAARFIRGNLFIPDPRKYWKTFAVKEATQLIKIHTIQTLITAGPPHSTHFIGKTLKAKNNLRWICDFHDLWTDVIYYDLLFHLPAVKKYDNKLERYIVHSCDHILTVGEKYKQKLLSKSSKISPDKISLVRIGYDSSLFNGEPVNTAEAFTVAYVGSIAEYYQPEVFFKAIQPIASTDAKVRINFVGIASPNIKQLVEKYGLQNAFSEVGYVDHEKAVLYMRQATVLLLINPVTKDEAMIIPGKIYEYLATGKPIINITRKESETALLINECKAGKTFERHETELLQEYLQHLYSLWKEGRLSSLSPDMEAIKQYSHHQIARHLDSLLQRL
jgi:glycosyltransferase involved in cell wall biosynthesis